MRILRVINSLDIGGAERSIVENVPVHKKNGLDIDVLLLNGKETHFLAKLKKEGINVYSLGVDNNIYNPLLTFKIMNIIKNYDIVHAHLFPCLYWVALAKVFSFSKVKLVFTEHATYNRRRSMIFFKFFDRYIYSKYLVIITISEAAKENLSKHLNTSNRLKVIENGVNFERLKHEQSKGNPLSEFNKKRVLLQIASFRGAKDQDTLIKALTLLPTEYIAMFIGDGERLDVCRELAEELKVSERVHFLGIKDEIGKYIECAEFVIVSSHWEGFGRAAVEGMGMGKPVLASNVAGLRDVVNCEGLLFEPGNERQLAKKVLDISIDKNKYNLMSQYCLSRSKQFGIERMVSKYECVYNSLEK